MHILELLAFLRELVTREIDALLDAFPSALESFRDAFLDAFLTVADFCLNVFADSPPRARHRRLRLSAAPTTMEDAALLCPPAYPASDTSIDDDVARLTELVAAAMGLHFPESPTREEALDHLRSLEGHCVAARLVFESIHDPRELLSMTEQRNALARALAHAGIDRPRVATDGPQEPQEPQPDSVDSSVAARNGVDGDAQQLDDGAPHKQAEANDDDEAVEPLTTELVELHDANEPSAAAAMDAAFLDDDASSLYSIASTTPSIVDDENASAPPSLVLSDWSEAIARVPGRARELPPGWNTDWTQNLYVPLRPNSEANSDDLSVRDSESVVGDAQFSVPSPPVTGPPGSFVSISDIALAAIAAQQPTPSPSAVVEELGSDEPHELAVAITASPIVDEPVATTAPIGDDVAITHNVSPPLSQSSVSSRSSSKRSTLVPGVSYRALTEQLARDADEGDGPGFYRAALQKLKEEREARLRGAAASSSTSNASPLVGIQLRPTLVVPQYDSSSLKQKVDDLRQRMTPFEIKYGRPLRVDTNPAYAV